MAELLMRILENYGLPLTLVAFFIWRDYVRELAMTKRISDLDEEIRKILVDLVTKTSAIIVANSEAMRDFMQVLRDRPCVADELAQRIVKEVLEKTDKLSKK